MVNQMTNIALFVTVTTPCCNYNVMLHLMIAVKIEYYVVYKESAIYYIIGEVWRN